MKSKKGTLSKNLCKICYGRCTYEEIVSIAGSSLAILGGFIASFESTLTLTLILLALVAVVFYFQIIIWKLEKQKYLIKMHIKDNKLIIDTWIPKEPIYKTKTSILLIKHSAPYVVRHSIPKTFEFDLPIKVRKVKFRIPSPKIHVLFTKHLISFLRFGYRDDLNGIGYFYVIGRGFYPGLICGLKMSYNEIPMSSPTNEKARLEIIRDKVVSGDVISEPEPAFEGYLINDRFLVAGDVAVNSLNELSRYSTVEEGPEVDSYVDVEELVGKYGLLSEDAIPKKNFANLDVDEYVVDIYDKKVVKKLVVHSCGALPYDDVVLGVTNKGNFVLLNKKHEILYKLSEIIEVDLVVIKSGNVVYKLDTRSLNKNEINRVKRLEGDLALNVVTKDCSLTVFANKDALLKNLKAYVKTKTKVNKSITNAELLRSLLTDDRVDYIRFFLDFVNFRGI
ncbi:MAG: hypothetical protein NO110_07400 [Sulfolobales archaeon]|nr:hypothetical protein [Sulfolobales archaeon]